MINLTSFCLHWLISRHCYSNEILFALQQVRNETQLIKSSLFMCSDWVAQSASRGDNKENTRADPPTPTYMHTEIQIHMHKSINTHKHTTTHSTPCLQQLSLEKHSWAPDLSPGRNQRGCGVTGGWLGGGGEGGGVNQLINQWNVFLWNSSGKIFGFD